MIRNVVVVPHHPDWSEMFQAEAAQIAGVLGPEVVAIHHVGSTAIPTISAKPIIDILVEAQDIERIEAYNDEMAKLGYEARGEFGIPGRRYFVKGGVYARTHHIHTLQAGDPEAVRMLNFRNYLLSHPEAARAYSRLKEELARRFPEDIEGYMTGKDGFIKEIIRKAKLESANHQAR